MDTFDTPFLPPEEEYNQNESAGNSGEEFDAEQADEIFKSVSKSLPRPDLQTVCVSL